MKGSVRIVALATTILLIAPVFLSACPLCKDAKSDADYLGGSASLPSGFYYSILLMVTAPFVVVGALMLRIFIARRRRRQELAESLSVPQASPQPPGAWL
jgi:hypothetical protein